MEISIRSQDAPKATGGAHVKEEGTRQCRPATNTQRQGPYREGEKVRERGREIEREREYSTPFALLVKVLISCYMCQNFNDADKSCSQNGLLCALV